MKHNGDSIDLKALCKECYYGDDCSQKLHSKDRCDVFLKKKKIEIGDNISINPMDTIQMSYDDLKDLIEDLDRESENKLYERDTEKQNAEIAGTLEKRRSLRVDINNFISYYLLDENDTIFKTGLGKTKNISDVGILIATDKIIETGNILFSIIDERNNIIEMKGKVRHSRKEKNGLIYTGIELIGDDDKKSELAKHFIKAHRKNQD